MIHDEGTTPSPVVGDDNLEPYRRMVELQRQLIELMKQQELMKRENEQLREQVAHEMALLCRPRRGLTARLWRRIRLLSQRVKRAADTSDAFPSSSQSTET